MKYNKKYGAALSPQQLDCVKENADHLNYDEKKAEVWAIGLTTLCASLNRNINDYYDWNRYEVRYDMLKSSYEQMREIGYSEQLISTLQQCLEVDETRRSTLLEIIEFLAPYQDEIRKGKHSFGFHHDNECDVQLLQPKIHDVEVHHQRPMYKDNTHHHHQNYNVQEHVTSMPKTQRNVSYTHTQQPLTTSYVVNQHQNEPVRYSHAGGHGNTTRVVQGNSQSGHTGTVKRQNYSNNPLSGITGGSGVVHRNMGSSQTHSGQGRAMY